MNDYNENENFSLKQYFQEIIQDKIEKFNTLVQWTDEEKKDFKILIDELDKPSPNTKAHGDKLEKIVEFIFNKTFFFEIYRNVHTVTNEIDDVITISNKGKQALHECNLSRDLLEIPTDIFIGECKNYSEPLGVTYVGKFYSLMKSVNVSFGIIFTQHGLTGSSKGFKDAYGLANILKMVEELRNPDTKFYIITFTKEDYIKMIEGTTFFEIVKAKKLELKLHSDYNSFLSKCDKHKAENEIKLIMSEIDITC